MDPRDPSLKVMVGDMDDDLKSIATDMGDVKEKMEKYMGDVKEKMEENLGEEENIGGNVEKEDATGEMSVTDFMVSMRDEILELRADVRKNRTMNLLENQMVSTMGEVRDKVKTNVEKIITLDNRLASENRRIANLEYLISKYEKAKGEEAAAKKAMEEEAGAKEEEAAAKKAKEE